MRSRPAREIDRPGLDRLAPRRDDQNPSAICSGANWCRVARTSRCRRLRASRGGSAFPRGDSGERLGEDFLRREQRGQPADGPLGRNRQARLVEERRLFRRAGVRVGDVDGQRAGAEEVVRPRLRAVGVGVEGQRDVTSRSPPDRRCAPFPPRGASAGLPAALTHLLALGDFSSDSGSTPPAQELLVEQELLMQRNIGLDALDHHFGQRDAHPRDGLLARVAVAMTLPIIES